LVGFCYEKKSKRLEKFIHIKGRDLFVKVKSVGESLAEVFDFEVEEDHAYVANGLVSHNSVDTLQLLRQHGYTVGTLSVDTSTGPYDFTKNALYSGRLSLPPHTKLALELASLEKDVKANKIDHPPQGSYVGDTQVLLLNGASMTMVQLAEDAARGRIHFGVSYDVLKGRAVHLPLFNPRITMYTDVLIDIELENGKVFRSTLDHRYLLTDGSYKEAQFLTQEDELQF